MGLMSMEHSSNVHGLVSAATWCVARTCVGVLFSVPAVVCAATARTKTRTTSRLATKTFLRTLACHPSCDAVFVQEPGLLHPTFRAKESE